MSDRCAAPIALAIGQPWQHGLLGDDDMAALFGERAQCQHLRNVQIAWLQVRADAALIDPATARRAIERVRSAALDVDALAAGGERDGVVVPALVAMLRRDQPDPVALAIHAGLTSQDVVDAAALLTARQVNALLETRLLGVLRHIDEAVGAHGERRITGRTRMQAAGSLRVGERLLAWRGPVARAVERLSEVSGRLLAYAPGGALGIGIDLPDGVRLGAELATRLRLFPGKPRHSQRDTWVEYGQCLGNLSGALGRIGMDSCLMAQQGIDELALANGGTSSAMPHKRNPVAAETLVSLSRFGAALGCALGGAMVHELERSGSAWTLEWMALSQLQLVAAASLRHADRLLGDIERIGHDP